MSAADKFSTETVTWVQTWTPSLFSFRCTRPAGFRFTPGQFARLGVEKFDPEATGADAGRRIVWRAYSIVSANFDEHLEFYSIVVPGGEFTSELSCLAPGDRLYVEKVPYGFLTTDRFQGGRDLWLLATGTGLAPFLSILWDAQVWADYDNLILVHGVRQHAELTYRDTIAAYADHPLLADARARLRYIGAVTREPVDADSGLLSGRIPQLIEDGHLERAAGFALSPEDSRVMLCGNPAMVDDTRKLLAGRGMVTVRSTRPGQIAVENYW